MKLKISFQNQRDCTISEHGFESVVVDVLIDIERFKHVQRMAKVYIPRGGCITYENGEKMRSTDYRVDVNDGHDPVPVGVKFGLNDPHAVVRVRVVE